jgi:hypothetical protein
MADRRSSLGLRSFLACVPAIWLCAALLVAACGGAAKPASVTPTTPEQERVFEHGVDFVAALEGLEGRWRDDWDRDLQLRVGGADFIGIVLINTLLTETDPEQRVTHRLVASIKRSLYGQAKDVELRVSEGQPGFTTVHDNLQRIESREFLVYVKWYVDADGERAAHFHLSPASEVIVTETERSVTLRSGGETPQPQERVVVHNN